MESAYIISFTLYLPKNNWILSVITAFIFFFFLRMRLRPIVGQPVSSSIISRVELGQTTIQLRKRAGFDDVGHRLGPTTGAQISVCKTPCLSTGTAMPLAGAETVQERPLLSWKGKPGCRIVGSSTKWALTTGADFQDSLHWLLMSVGVMTLHKGFLDVRRSCGGLRISWWISCGKESTTIYSAVLVQYQRVKDGRTDGQTSSLYLLRASA